MNRFAFISNVETHPTLGAASGHEPLTFDTPLGADRKPSSPRTSYNFKAADWKECRSVLGEQIKSWNKPCKTYKKPHELRKHPMQTSRIPTLGADWRGCRQTAYSLRNDKKANFKKPRASLYHKKMYSDKV